MGLVLRTIVAVGVVYALSPLREADPPVAELAAAAKSGLAVQAEKAVGAAVERCVRDKEGCVLTGVTAQAAAAALMGGAATHADEASTAARRRDVRRAP
ncbi:hypothetical protein ABEG18_04150 [Alsobacter sp. KACC 23698]|uniref:DUF5330 domain-containing protein n=1 Tax=Alsobacter sp. KACC 23698 TaxID=3149229 RepID=A0AAU7JI58_9HYPH